MTDGYCRACGRYRLLSGAVAMCAACMTAWYDARTPHPAEITLDGCCGIGGAAAGLAGAGHYVIGVDVNPALRDDYLRSGAAEFHCASVLDVLSDAAFMARITFAWVSPPCQHFSRMCRCRPGLRAQYPDLITPSRPLLERWGGPWAMENVYGALGWMKAPVVLCMHGHFGRDFYRHRLIETGGGFLLDQPEPRFGHGARVSRECGCGHPVPAAKAGHWKPGYFVSVSGHERKEQVRRVMEIRWAREREDVAEAIPPYLARWAADELAAWRAAEAA